MAEIEVVRDAPVAPQAPVDESVKIPPSVKRAAARANRHYGKKGELKASPSAPDEPETPPEAPEPAAAALPPVEPVTEPVAEPVPGSEAAPLAPAAPPAEEPLLVPISPEQWEHRYNSMKGRYDSSVQTIAAMQDQMQQLGDELMRTQAMLQHPATPQPGPVEFVTPEDRQNYGDELLDLVARGARQAVEPELNELKQTADSLRQQLTKAGQQGVVEALNRALPNWRDINQDPRFKNWLRLRDIYSGGVRQALLNAAFQAADAPRVVAFFQGFVTDEAATGHAELNPPAPQQPNAAPARQPAVPLSSLAAPGRARPASGNSSMPADKPIFTRIQISKFYSDVRKGVYAGREAEKDRQEKEIFSAQRDGRVRG
jgi:hypothetical protein